MEHVEFITTESGDDLVVSFALSAGEPGEIRSLILHRALTYRTGTQTWAFVVG